MVEAILREWRYMTQEEIHRGLERCLEGAGSFILIMEIEFEAICGDIAGIRCCDLVLGPCAVN